MVMADNASVTTDVVHVRGTWAEEEAKLNPQQVQIITKKEIEKKQVSQKVFELVSIIYKLTDYKSKYFEFKLKDNENSI